RSIWCLDKSSRIRPSRRRTASFRSRPPGPPGALVITGGLPVVEDPATDLRRQLTGKAVPPGTAELAERLPAIPEDHHLLDPAQLTAPVQRQGAQCHRQGTLVRRRSHEPRKLIRGHERTRNIRRAHQQHTIVTVPEFTDNRRPEDVPHTQ